jgi:ribosomal protein S18 acetylase RimI-like enzyme
VTNTSSAANTADQPSWTIGVWPFDATTAMLTLQSAHRPDVTVTTSLVEEWADATATSTFQRVRTSAVAPTTAEALMEHGFVVRQELEFLVSELDVADLADTPHSDAGSAWRIGRVRPSDAVRIDVAAFGDEWALDAAAFAHSCNATRNSRVRGARRGSLPRPAGLGRALAYCLTGVSEDTSYLQRLAVMPSAQRHGAASALIADSMRWAVTQGARRMFVNTDIDNVGALSLYERWGFESVGYHLRVMECDRATLIGHRHGHGQ